MIQRKNKFLTILYIRKCKITYLECFAIIQMGGCYGQLFSSSEARRYSGALHTLEHGDGEVNRWVDAQGNHTDRAGALWGTLRERVRPHKCGCTCWEYRLVNKCNGPKKDIQRNIMYMSVFVCVSGYDFCIKKNQKTPLNKTVAHSTSCQRKYYHEGFGFHLLVMEVVSESLKVFIPCNFLLQRGIEELPLSNYITHIHIFKSLKTPLPLGLG